MAPMLVLVLVLVVLVRAVALVVAVAALTMAVAAAISNGGSGGGGGCGGGDGGDRGGGGGGVLGVHVTAQEQIAQVARSCAQHATLRARTAHLHEQLRHLSCVSQSVILKGTSSYNRECCVAASE